ncbi:MAG: hypothetical protein FJ255_07710 [Phycisphaerae bacterium]|nr:hypothetical protein [Phycisphaerae bacterium]
MMDDRDITALLRMAREAGSIERSASRAVAPRLALAAGLALAASATLLVLSRVPSRSAPTPGAPTAEATTGRVPVESAADARPDDERGRVLLAIFRDGAEQAPCVIHKDVGDAPGSALARLSRQDLAQLAGRCQSGPLRVLLVELAGPLRLLPATPQDAGALAACLDLAEDRQADWGCAAAACVPPEVTVTTARVALAPPR